jgi:Uncharacterized small protein (DUF2292).
MGGQEQHGQKVIPLSNESKELSIEEALRRVRKGLEQIKFGEIIVKVENGKPVWVDKHERERVG